MAATPLEPAVSRLSRDPIEAGVDGFTHGGEGVVRIEGKAVFVAGALPGEHVRLQVTTDRKRWARGKLLEVVRPSPDRVVPSCPYVPECGGCDLQHVSAAGQLDLKARVVREQLERIGRLEDPPVRACVAVGPELGYRTQARMHADDSGRLGFHQQGTNQVVPIDRCIVLTDATQSVRAAIGDDTGATEAIFHTTSTGDCAAVLTMPGSSQSPSIDDVDATISIATRQPDRPVQVLRGSGVVVEHVAGFEFNVPAGGFFQGNTPGAGALVTAVRRAVDDSVDSPVPGTAATTAADTAGTTAVGPGEIATAEGATVTGPIVWDLYAGVGLFTLPLAAGGSVVTAVEVVGDAVTHLATNADRAGLADRVEAVAADVAAFVTRPKVANPDIVVLDPPRTGAGIEVMTALAQRVHTTIVYVACDPAALARDARVLVDGGWELVSVQPFDLFPMTHHVEAVATFRR